MSSTKKGQPKDIDQNDIQIAGFKDFQKKNSVDPKLQSMERPMNPASNMRDYSARDGREDPLGAPGSGLGVTRSVNEAHFSHNPASFGADAARQSQVKEEESDNYSDKDDEAEYDMDLEEAEQRMKDELDDEVDKKIEAMRDLALVRGQPGKLDDDDEDATQHHDDLSPARSSEFLKEDTIKTEKINELMQAEA